ncbi:hypothetical protein [Emticicia sp. C21]|uniref:hypothetical protein n=1 Tax=Emticicia sp. C21 TaxID=2302915 RepID=UPI000E3434EE|nr:hypothetical protein [Emticicia sp. C21]RFS17625.1 hypothetical protein D0T08_07615 [Emticicia sp. C21]
MIQKNNSVISIAILAWVSLVFLVIFSPNRLIDAESIYYANLQSKSSPFSIEFIRDYQGTAGIITTWFNLLIMDITQGDIVRMRIANLFWLFLTALLFNESLKEESQNTDKFLGYNLVLTPYVFQMTARVMGDYPTFFFGFAFYILVNKLEKEDREWYWYLITGLCGSLAIAGKQTFIFLLIFPVYYIATIKDNYWKKAILLISSCALPAYFYWIWGGFVPKSSSYHHVKLVNVDFIYVFVFLFALSLMFFFAYIKEFIVKNLRMQLLIAIVVHLLFGLVVPFPFLRSYSVQLSGFSFMIIIKYAWSIAMVLSALAGVTFFFRCCIEILSDRKNIPLILFVCLCLLAASRVPYFHGRYLALIMPFILMIFFKAKQALITPLTALAGYFFNLVTLLILYHAVLITDTIRLIMKTMGIEKI